MKKNNNTTAPRLIANGTYLFSGKDLSGPDAPLINYSGAKQNKILDKKIEQDQRQYVDTEVNRLMKVANEKENLLG